MHRQITRFGCEVPDRIVPPVIAQPLLHEIAVVDERLDGQQLDARDAEVDEVLDHPRRGQAEERSARLVEHRAHPGHVRRTVVAPRERRVDDDRFGHAAGVVATVEAEVAARRADAVAVVSVAPADRSVQRLRVRIEQQFVMVETVPVGRVVGAVHAVAVQGARPQPRQVPVPHLIGILRQRVARDLAASACVEDAQVDALRVCREEGEVHARTVPGRSQRVGAAGFESFRRHQGAK